MDCSLPGSSVHGSSPGKNTEVSCHAPLQGIFQTEGLSSGLLLCRQILYNLSCQGSPAIFIYVCVCVCVCVCMCVCVCVCMHVCILNCSVMLNSNLMDCSLPGFSVHGIFQTRIPKPAAIPRDLPDPTKGSDPCLPHWQVDC